MFKLILIELKKIFKKKSIFVMMIIMLLFNLLNNILFYTDYDNDGNYKYLDGENLEEEKNLLEKELSKYDYNDIVNSSMIVELNTKLDVITLKESYKVGSWQYNKVNDYLYNVIESINVYTHQVSDSEKLNKYKIKLEELIDKFNNDDWKYFVNIEIGSIENELLELNKNLQLVSDEREKIEINNLIDSKNKELNELRYRIENDITYDKSYLNNALNKYNRAIEEIRYYEKEKDNLSLEEEVIYQGIKEDVEINKYILDNKQNYNKQNNLNYQLRTIVDDYEIFIIIIILMIAGTIVAEEITSGTIKLLLIKPYSRGKILLSKYFSAVIFMIIIILYLILLQIFIGGYIFGFSSLKIPVIVYNFNKSNIIEYNIFVYMIIRVITKLPILIMLITISFSLSTVINNIATSITIPLFIYIFTPSINYLILQYKINILKYLVNINWEFNKYLFGKKLGIDGLSMQFSLIVWIIYFVGIMVFTYINFKRKNIRNV